MLTSVVEMVMGVGPPQNTGAVVVIGVSVIDSKVDVQLHSVLVLVLDSATGVQLHSGVVVELRTVLDSEVEVGVGVQLHSLSEVTV